MAEETSFYSDESGVRVTDKRVIIRNTTYSLANITSVSTRIENPSRMGPVLVIAVGGIFLLEGLSVHSTGGAAAALGVGAAAVLIGYFWYRGCKPIWHLRIGSASGESTPLSSIKQEWIQGIARAINEAIIHRA